MQTCSDSYTTEEDLYESLLNKSPRYFVLVFGLKYQMPKFEGVLSLFWGNVNLGISSHSSTELDHISFCVKWKRFLARLHWAGELKYLVFRKQRKCCCSGLSECLMSSDYLKGLGQLGNPTFV